MTPKKKFSGANWLAIIAFLFVMFISATISVVIFGQIKNDLYKNKDNSVVSSGKVLNRYIIDTYELYYDSGTLKFQEVMNHINELSNDFSSFQVVSVDGNVLFDSSQKDVNERTNLEKSNLSPDIINATSIYTQKTNEKIDYIVVPHVDDWGNHKYSIRYSTNYNDVNEKLDRYRIILIIITFGVDITALLVLILFAYNEKYRIEKAHIRDLANINYIKDEFMGLVSHNLRTPLSVIKGYMSFITDPNSPKEEMKEDIANMGEGVKKLSSLVEDIVFATSILSGGEKFVSEDVNIEKIIGETRLKYDEQIRSKNLQFNYTLEGGETFTGDKKALGRIFDNLIENAVKFDLENGSVDVRLENSSELKITVSDTGVGIESDKLDSIVGFFHRGSDILNYNFEGEGLGLYLTNLIVKHYNGQVHVTSEKDKGSTFEVILKKESK